MSTNIFRDHAATFKDHVATYEKYGKHIETLQWKAPGTSIYAIWYVRQFGTLMVFGDCYEAIYQWYPDVSLKTIATFDLGYCIGKCRASPHGREPYIWNADTARETLQAYFAAFKDAKYDTGYETERAERDQEFEKFNDTGGFQCIDNKFEWYAWCHAYADDTFGDAWYETEVADPGRLLYPCIELHFEGLKLAMAQLADKGLV